MDFDIPEFKKRLERERITGNAPAEVIQQEIRQAEEVKAGISEENDHASEFVSEAINRIDTYTFSSSMKWRKSTIRQILIWISRPI
ncbi:hypothetical protein [Rufibacter sp. XAAS-G3-1]|uniref:hypothetical protein n=1 Tax=Rufibacter sp. XAAS-G3-1 TaxID=2729134 RepID=UPI0015E66587|nr:hypothetical protein [Rufibacter sp. XAAS-G3-1]